MLFTKRHNKKLCNHQWKNLYNQAIDSNIKQYEEIKKFATGQGEDYTTVRLLNFDYIKNHYRLLALGLSTQRQLNVDPKGI